jgi:hypothetical protein
VIVLEGEKICDLADKIGVTTTTAAHGAKSPRRTDWSPLAGKTVILVPDHDAAGEGYVNAVGDELAKLNPKPVIRIARLPLKDEGDDFEQWLEACPDTWGPDECRAEIERLAVEWTPPPEQPEWKLVIIKLSGVKPEPVEYLVPP